jgi:hypothetical protein
MHIWKGKYVKAVEGTDNSIIKEKEYLITDIIFNGIIVVKIEMLDPFYFSQPLFEKYFGKFQFGIKSINPNIKVL